MRYVLPKLPYDYDALEPYIDKRTMILHHTAHHQGYVDKLNSILSASPLSEKPIEELLACLDSVPSNIRLEVRHNGGGHANHSFFWRSLTPPSHNNPSTTLSAAIDASFGGVATLKEKFSALSSSHFASGWAWVCLDKEGKMILTQTADHDSPWAIDLFPLLVLDLWEHAYYLKHQNRRAEYINSFWNVVNWAEMEKRMASWHLDCTNTGIRCA